MTDARKPTGVPALDSDNVRNDAHGHHLPVTGWIMPNRDGTFDPLAEFEPGAVRAEFLHITEDGELIDTAAWEAERPGTWWLQRDIATHAGEHELTWAWYDQRPARMVATPADFVAAHGAGFCIVDWTADINAIVGRVAAVECSTPTLYKRLRETLIAQSLPRGLTITVRQERRAA